MWNISRRKKYKRWVLFQFLKCSDIDSDVGVAGLQRQTLRPTEYVQRGLRGHVREEKTTGQHGGEKNREKVSPSSACRLVLIV